MKQTSHRNIYLLLVLATVSAAAGCSADPQKDTGKSLPPVMVTVASPAGRGENTLQLSGQVEASQSAAISTRVMGYITMLKVNTGDQVQKGQLLAVISSEDILAKRAQAEARIAEAETGFNNAQKDLDRFTELYRQQSASVKEMDNVRMQYSSAKAGLDAARQMRNEISALLAYTRLTAPFAGTVTRKNADAGSMATPGMPILVIEQKSALQVSAAVPETEISQVRTGQKARVSIRSAGKTFTGAIAQLNPSSQFTGSQYTIKISIPENEKKDLYAGMYADIALPLLYRETTGNPAGILVPAASIQHTNQLTGLYTIGSNNTALLRWVRLGKTYGDQVEVLSGLSAGETFITSAEGRLYNGAPVAIRK